MSFILCPECGYNIGAVSKFISLVKKGRNKRNNKKISNVNPEVIELCPDLVEPIGDIMDMAGVTKLCCRTHILGETDFDNIYRHK